MRSRWSSKNAKKLASEYDRSVKNFHPETIRVVRAIFENIKIGNRVSWHGITQDFQVRVCKELKALGYEVVCHGTMYSPDTVKYEVRVV